MDARIVAGQKALAWIDPSDAPLLADDQGDLRSDGSAVKTRISRRHAQPVTSVRRHIPQHAGAASGNGDEQIERAVAVDVPHRQGAGHVGSSTQIGVVDGNVAELAGAAAGEDLVALGVGGPVVAFDGIRGSHDPAVGDCQVETAVVIEVGQDRSKARAAPAGAEQVGRGRAVGEQSPRLLSPQGMRLLGQMGDKQIEQAALVRVAQRHSLSRERIAKRFDPLFTLLRRQNLQQLLFSLLLNSLIRLFPLTFAFGKNPLDLFGLPVIKL